MLHEQSSALGMTLIAVVEELMGDLRKLRIEREQEVEESVVVSSKVVRNLRRSWRISPPGDPSTSRDSSDPDRCQQFPSSLAPRIFQALLHVAF